jgi:hypothetical protein
VKCDRGRRQVYIHTEYTRESQATTRERKEQQEEYIYICMDFLSPAETLNSNIFFIAVDALREFSINRER